ncbi:hypothetical protein TVAG_237160 [Trichomonas vaginalis G3]|uniref:Uncharacterized protein n=1 Tax=Trichomonas vaginalis (strain ATCC PRA-98 / G3) TaxID=412133 RepID=A2DCR6_TRIV3|nr:hypothetical protein TVAGG3_0607120 [Trichomonas vaginalis G3]EAY21690.1 hypothetical protein TVAG_237160 [Trichomonas vaginalis G3]KAI5524330.1 hypothetical protein TVAGG3_0607120 [Trichomonas vaginalis G3]|eukprot:XP_001582676.1 hypothetical protein [Trichomonas vaginalis G3]
MSRNLWVDDDSSDDDAVWASANTKFQTKKQNGPQKIIDTSGGYQKAKRNKTTNQNQNTSSNGTSKSPWNYQQSDSDEDLKGWGNKSSQNSEKSEQNTTKNRNTSFSSQKSSEKPKTNEDTSGGYKKKENAENSDLDHGFNTSQNPNSNKNDLSSNISHENSNYNRPGMLPPDDTGNASQTANQPPPFQNQNIYPTGYPEGYLPSAQPVSENILDIQGEPEIEVEGWGKKWSPNDLGSDWKVITNQYGGGAPPSRAKKPLFNQRKYFDN